MSVFYENYEFLISVQSNCLEFWHMCIQELAVGLVSSSLTAMVFSLMPPTGRIFPVKDTSPVMATFCRAGVFIARESRAVTMVQPALGPSFGVAPWRNENSSRHFKSRTAYEPSLYNTFHYPLKDAVTNQKKNHETQLPLPTVTTRLYIAVPDQKHYAFYHKYDFRKSAL